MPLIIVGGGGTIDAVGGVPFRRAFRSRGVGSHPSGYCGAMSDDSWPVERLPGPGDHRDGEVDRIGVWLYSSLFPASTDRLVSLLTVVLGASMDGITVLRAIRDREGMVVDFEVAAMSASAERLLNEQAMDLVGTRLSHARHGVPDERMTQYAEVVESGTTWTSRIRRSRNDDPPGGDRWYDVSATGLVRQGLVMIFRDVTDQISKDAWIRGTEQRQRALERQALHDPLTGLPNRLLVTTRLEHGLSRLARVQLLLAVMFVDIDGFKSINDEHGHATGDAVLVEIGRRMAAVARASDTVGRFGGDEFVIVCEDLVSVWDIDRLAHRFVSVCAEPVIVGEVRVDITASVGVAIGSSSAHEADVLIGDADRAMYRSKAEGGGRVEYSDAVVHRKTLARHDIEVGLQQAIDDHDLHIDFDPILSADGETVAFRTAIGWTHPRHGLVDGATLLDAADTTGIAAAFADWTFEQAFVHVGAWSATTTERPRFVMIDVDAAALEDLGFSDRLVNSLDRHHIDPRSLCLAIDGDYLTSHVEEAKSVLDPLATLGIRIARDGVAAPGSSMTYLRNLPIDIVILDSTLTQQAATADDALVRLVIETAKHAHRLVMAAADPAGADNDRLLSLGVDLVQSRFDFSTKTRWRSSPVTRTSTR